MQDQFVIDAGAQDRNDEQEGHQEGDGEDRLQEERRLEDSMTGITRVTDNLDEHDDHHPQHDR